MKVRSNVSITVLVVILALVPNANATGYMDGSNWTGINKILNDLGFGAIFGNDDSYNNDTWDATSTLVTANSDTWNSASTNPATANLNMDNYSITNAENISAKQIGGVIYADQYATLQDAVNASNNTGFSVYVAAGTYPISKQLIISDNTTFSGAGMGKTIIYLPANVALEDTTTGSGCYVGAQNCNNAALMRNEDYNGYTKLGNKNITLRDFTLRWDNQTVPSWGGAIYGTGISMRWIQNLEINNVEVLNAPFSGLDISGGGTVYLNPTAWYPTNANIHNNRIINAGNNVGGIGILLTYYVSNSIIHNNYIKNATYGIEIEDQSYKNIVSSNVVSDSGISGLYDITSTKSIWSSNQVDNSGRAGFDSMNSIESIVSGNIFTNQMYGINISLMRSQVSNNYIAYSTMKGIYILSKNYNSITGNKIHNTNGEGINLTTVLRSFIQGNSIMDDRVGASQSYAINETGSSDYNVIINNNYQNTLAGGSIVGSVTACKYNFNVTNSGQVIEGC